MCLLCPLDLNAAPRDGQVGVGIRLGEPTGLTGKVFLTPQHALDAALSYSLRDSRIHMHGNYLIHFPKHGETLAAGTWLPYVGLGASIRLKGEDSNNDRDNHLAARLPCGVSFFLTSSPLEIFMELAPNMGLIPHTRFGFDGGLGIRYLF